MSKYRLTINASRRGIALFIDAGDDAEAIRKAEMIVARFDTADAAVDLQSPKDWTSLALPSARTGRRPSAA